MKRIVAKFGGSSVSNPIQFKKVKDILGLNNERSIVVVSAPGKDEENKSKITDLLLLLHAHMEYNIQYDYLLDSIYQRYQAICDGLLLTCNFRKVFEDFKKSLNPSLSKDFIVSRGEYFNAMIMSEYLGFEFLDAKDVIFMHHDGTIDYKKTQEALASCVKDGKSYVVPGFYASTPESQIRTFNRGGSDLTGSILSVSLNAELYENWTDVNGLYVADPTIIADPERIKKITYTELRELAYRGANIIQQESLIPLAKTDISIHIRNTNEPNEDGTVISKTIKDNGAIITGMSGFTDFTALTFEKDCLVNLTQILKDVLNIFIKYNITVEHMPTGIDTFNIIVKTNPLKKVYFDIMNELRHIDGIIEINTEDDIALIAIVGRNMSYIPGVAGRIFETLGKHKTNIKVIAQASNEISIIIGVKKDDYKTAIQVLYNEFYL